MPLVAVIASGLVAAFNRLLLTGLVGKVLLGGVLWYVIGTLFAAVLSLISQYLVPVDLQQYFASTGLGFYWDYFKIYAWINAVLGAVIVRFIIRRLPFVG